MKNISFLLLMNVLLFSSIGRAQTPDGFNSGTFIGWTQAGMPQVVTSPVPADTTYAAYLQSTSHDGVDNGMGGTTYTQSASAATLDSDLQVTLPATGIGTQAPVNGQAIYQTFTLDAASILTFQYTGATNDSFPYDSAGFVLDHTYTELVNTETAGPTAPDYQTFHVALDAGTHTVGFVAYNSGDDVTSTSLYVANVSLLAVPEPGTLGLLALGLAGVALVRRVKVRAA